MPTVFYISYSKALEILFENYKDALEFLVVIEGIQTFPEPVFDAIVNEDEWQKDWNFITKWNENEGNL